MYKTKGGIGYIFSSSGGLKGLYSRYGGDEVHHCGGSGWIPTTKQVVSVQIVTFILSLIYSFPFQWKLNAIILSQSTL